MSTAELSAPRGDTPATSGMGRRSPGGPCPGNALRGWMRLLGSELRLMFRRWRNLALLGVTVVLPVVLAIGLRVSMPHGGGGGGGSGPGASFFAQLAGNGVFLSFLALTILLTLVLPLVVAVVAGDSIAGEAGLGTLRYLLTVPAGRTRLLSVKYWPWSSSGWPLPAGVGGVAGRGRDPVPDRAGDAAVGDDRVPGGRPAAAAVRHAVRGRGDGRARRDRAGHLDPDRARRSARSPPS